MKLEELRALTPGDLAKHLEDARQELFNLRLRLVTKQLVNHREPVRVKKDIARILTVLKEKELGETARKS